MRSAYSSEEVEQQFFSDDSVGGGHQNNQVGVVDKPNDNFAYVDAMTNRLNATDNRMLRAAINEDKQIKQKNAVDNERGQQTGKDSSMAI